MTSEQIAQPIEDNLNNPDLRPNDNNFDYRVELWRNNMRNLLLNKILDAILSNVQANIVVPILDLDWLNKRLGSNFSQLNIPIDEFKKNRVIVELYVKRILRIVVDDLLDLQSRVSPTTATLTEDGNNVSTNNLGRPVNLNAEGLGPENRKLNFRKVLQAALAVTLPLNMGGSPSNVSIPVEKRTTQNSMVLYDQVNPLVAEMAETLKAEIEVWTNQLISGELDWKNLAKVIAQSIGRKPEQGPPNQDKKEVKIDKETGNIQIGDCNFTVAVEQVQQIEVKEFNMEDMWFVYIGPEKTSEQLNNFKTNLKKILEIFKNTQIYKNFVTAYKAAGIPITITSLDPNAEFNSASSFLGAGCVVSNIKGENSTARYVKLKHQTDESLFSGNPELPHMLSLFEELSHLLQNAYGLHNLVAAFGYDPTEDFKEYYEQILDIFVQYFFTNSVSKYESSNLQQILRHSVTYTSQSQSQYKMFSGMPVYGLGTILGQHILEELKKGNDFDFEVINRYLDLFVKFSENAQHYKERAKGSIWHAFNLFLKDEFKLSDFQWIKEGVVENDGSWYAAFIHKLIESSPDISLESNSRFPIEIVNTNNSSVLGGGGFSTVTVGNKDLNQPISIQLRNSERIALKVYRYNPVTKTILLVDSTKPVTIQPGEILIICLEGNKNSPKELSSYIVLDSPEKNNFNEKLAGIIEDTAIFIENVKEVFKWTLSSYDEEDPNINLLMKFLSENVVERKSNFFFCLTRIENSSQHFPYIELDGVFVYFIPHSLYVNQDEKVMDFFTRMQVPDGLGNFPVTIDLEEIIPRQAFERIKMERLNKFSDGFLENNFPLVVSILYSFTDEKELREFLEIGKFTVTIVDLGQNQTGTQPIVSRGENNEITLQIFSDNYKITFRKNNIHDQPRDIRIGNEIGVVRIWEFAEGINNLLSVQYIINWCKEGITSVDDVKKVIDQINLEQKDNGRTPISIDYEQDENQNITAIMLVDVVSGIFFRFELDSQSNRYWFRSIGQNNAVG